MIGEWCFYNKYFTKEQCDLILQEGLKLPEQKGNLGVNGEITDESFRKSRIRFIQKDDPNFTWLFQEIWKMAMECNDGWFGFHLSKMDYIQLAEYDSDYEGQYKKHHDVFWINGTNYQRKLSAVIQLTDPSEYEGGDLVLYTQQESPPPVNIKEQGSVIFFPSFIEHEAQKVTKGKRYSIACWFDGPHFV
jgi:PKHD-type hydroxylase